MISVKALHYLDYFTHLNHVSKGHWLNDIRKSMSLLDNFTYFTTWKSNLICTVWGPYLEFGPGSLAYDTNLNHGFVRETNRTLLSNEAILSQVPLCCRRSRWCTQVCLRPLCRPLLRLHPALVSSHGVIECSQLKLVIKISVKPPT